MVKYEMAIELLSDTCPGGGTGDGVEVDILSDFDEAGLPQIQGRRLKGLLRDNGSFLAEYKYKGITQELVDLVFGTEDETGLIEVGNAECKDASLIRKNFLDPPKEIKSLVSPRRVREAFLVRRVFTAINEEGVAKKKSLRMIGALPKGLTLYSEIRLKADKNGKEEDLLKDAVKLLRGIGLHRNRGLGEVRCSLKESSASSRSVERNECFYAGGEERIRLDYLLEFESSVRLLEDYVSGSALQGYFVNQLEKEARFHFLSSVLFSNAYLSDGKHRFPPFPLGMMSEKGKGEEVYSTADEAELKEKKLYKKREGYCLIEDENNLRFVSVMKNEELHFTKAIRKIYSLTSLVRGQLFMGSIYAPRKDLAVLYPILEREDFRVKIGASKSAQYGNVRLYLAEEEKEEDSLLVFENEGSFVLELLADTVLMDGYGINRTDQEILKENIEKLFILEEKEETPVLNIKELYTETRTVGGYHAAWKLPKRRFQAFSKGTEVVVHISFPTKEGSKKVNLRKQGFMGLMKQEGFGEYRVREIRKTKVFTAKKMLKGEIDKERWKTAEITVGKSDFQEEIVKRVAFFMALEKCNLRGKQFIRQSEELHKLSSSQALRIIHAFKQAENERNNSGERIFEAKWKEYINQNYQGENNKELKAFTDALLKSFDDFMKKTDFNEKIIKAMHENRDYLLKNFIEQAIFCAKIELGEDKDDNP